MSAMMTNNNMNNKASNKLSKSQEDLLCSLCETFNYLDVDYILTKLVMNGWPTTWKDACNCIRNDNFCYFYAMGSCKNSASECFKRSRNTKNHVKEFNIGLLYNDGNASFENKRRAFYVAYYLYNYRQFYYSRQLELFKRALLNDRDYPFFTIDCFDLAQKIENQRLLRKQQRQNQNGAKDGKRKKNSKRRRKKNKNGATDDSSTNDTMSTASTVDTMSTMSTVSSVSADK